MDGCDGHPGAERLGATEPSRGDAHRLRRSLHRNRHPHHEGRDERRDSGSTAGSGIGSDPDLSVRLRGGLRGLRLTAFHAAVAPGRVESCLLIALKLAVHVALPCLLLAWSGETPRGFFTASVRGRAFRLTLAVLGVASLTLLSVISPSLKQISELGLAPSSLMLATLGAFGWIAVEAGLCEEFLFRSVLQSHPAAALQSPIAAGSELSHLRVGAWTRPVSPRRSGRPRPIEISARGAGLHRRRPIPRRRFRGLVWWRTRNLLLVVLLHACIDVLPFLPKFAGMWF